VAGRFLIASADPGTRELVRRAFAQFALEAETCEGAADAFALLHRRYEGVVLDCEDPELAVQLIAGVRQKAEGAGNTAVIALLPPDTPVQQVLTAGATVALHHPLRLERLMLSLRVALRLATPNEKAAAAKEEGRALARPQTSRR
jgi:DNA-binding response OmpR family regulator